MSLNDLASVSGITAGFLSQIENGKSDPSLSTIKRITDGLDINAYQLFEQTEVPDDRAFVKENERIRLKNFGGGVTIEFLSSFASVNLMEACIHIVEPAKKSGVVPYSHEGQEIFIVLDGQFDLTIGTDSFIMNKGDSYYLANSMTPHMFTNRQKDNSSKMLCISNPPFFYESKDHN